MAFDFNDPFDLGGSAPVYQGISGGFEAPQSPLTVESSPGNDLMGGFLRTLGTVGTSFLQGVGNAAAGALNRRLNGDADWTERAAFDGLAQPLQTQLQQQQASTQRLQWIVLGGGALAIVLGLILFVSRK